MIEHRLSHWGHPSVGRPVAVCRCGFRAAASNGELAHQAIEAHAAEKAAALDAELARIRQVAS